MARWCEPVGLMLAAAAFAVLTAASVPLAFAAAGGLVLVAWAAGRPEVLPRLGLFAVMAAVPLSYLGARVSVGGAGSFSKLAFAPALAVLVWDRAVSRRPWHVGRLAWYVALFGLALLLSYLVNAREAYSSRFLVRFAGMLLLFLLAAAALRHERDLAWFLGVIAGACLLSAVGALITPPPAHVNGLIGGVVRMTGWSVEDAPTFGTNLLVALLIGLYFALTARRLWVRLALGAMAAVLALAVVQTYARGVSLVLVAAVGYLLVRVRHRGVLGTALLVLGLGALCLLPLVPDAYWDRMQSMVTGYATDPTLGRRLTSYRIGWELFERHPLVGLGPGSFISQYMSPEYRFDRTVVPSVCFNLYLSIATQTGIVGLAAFGLLTLAAWRELRFVARSVVRSDTFAVQAAEVLEVVLVALLLVSLFEPTDLQKYLWAVFGAAAAVGRIRRAQLAAAAPDARGPHAA